MKISEKPEKISSLFQNSTFSIKHYQRDYSWKTKQITTLFDDIFGSKNSNYFLGTCYVYLDETEDSSIKQYELIDAQQRFTTLIISLKVFMDLIKCRINKKDIDNETNDKIAMLFSDTLKCIFHNEEKRKRKIKLNLKNENHMIFEDLMFKKIVDCSPEEFKDKIAYYSSDLILNNNVEFFSDKILTMHEINIMYNKKSVKKSVKNILNLVLNCQRYINSMDFLKKGFVFKNELNEIIKIFNKIMSCSLIKIEANDKDDLLNLFKMINSRGLKLNDIDLIKQSIYGNSNLDDLEDVVRIWDKIDNDFNDQSKMQDFLYYYINSLVETYNLNAEFNSNNDINYSVPFCKKEDLCYFYEKLSKRDLESKSAIKKISEEVKVYMSFFNPEHSENISKHKDLVLSLEMLKVLHIKKSTSLLLLLYRVYWENDKKFFKEMCSIIETLSLRMSIMKIEMKESEKIYYETMKNIHENLSKEEIKKPLKEFLKKFSDDSFKAAFKQASLKTNISKRIFANILHHYGNPVNNFYQDLDHIMPKSPDETKKNKEKKLTNEYSRWIDLYNKDKALYNSYLNRPGNMTPLYYKENRRLGNQEYINKYNTLKKSPLHSIFAFTDQWSYEEIDKRQELIANEIVKIWSIK